MLDTASSVRVGATRQLCHGPPDDVSIDHWRHAFMLLGLLWGLVAATWRYQLRAEASSVGPQEVRSAGQ